MHDLSDGSNYFAGWLWDLWKSLFEMITWAQLGLHQKPIGILNTNGFYDDLLRMLKKMVQLGFLKQENLELLIVDDSIDGLLDQMRKYVPISVPKWVKKDQV